MSKAKQKRSRANPMTPILRDLRVAVSRIEKVRDGLSKLELESLADEAMLVHSKIDSMANNIGEAWGSIAYKRAQKEIMDAYRIPVDQPLPTTNVEV